MLQRIHIIGTPGAGKTTLARRLAQQLGLNFIELDSLFWGLHWLPAEPAVFRKRVSASVRDPRWVACGNHTSARDLVWARADTVIWLDYSTRLGFVRLMGRAENQISSNLRAWLARQRAPMFGHDSLLLYAFRARQERKANFAALLAAHEFGHLKVLRFRAPSELEAWMRGMAEGEMGDSSRAIRNRA